MDHDDTVILEAPRVAFDDLPDLREVASVQRSEQSWADAKAVRDETVGSGKYELPTALPGAPLAA